jgi:chromosome segregation and condensation protein ScpB
MKTGHRQLEMIALLRANGPMTRKEIMAEMYLTNFWSVMDSLMRRGLIAHDNHDPQRYWLRKNGAA